MHLFDPFWITFYILIAVCWSNRGIILPETSSLELWHMNRASTHLCT